LNLHALSTTGKVINLYLNYNYANCLSKGGLKHKQRVLNCIKKWRIVCKIGRALNEGAGKGRQAGGERVRLKFQTTASLVPAAE
jgi:hypothetical protein